MGGLTAPPASVLGTWSSGTQLLRPTDDGEHRDPVDVLAAVSGVYSAHPTAMLSLAARMPGFDLRAYRALDEERTVARVPGVRRSKFLLPVDAAADHLACTRLPLTGHRWRLDEAGVAWADYPRLRTAVLRATDEPVTTRALRRRLADAKVPDVPAGLPAVVATMAYQGVLLRTAAGSALADDVRYVSTQNWLGGPMPDVEVEDAADRVIRGYLRSHGPVRLRDIAWWSGWSQRECTAGLRRLAAVDVGAGLFVDAADAGRFAAFRADPPDPAPGPVLLPPWDTYLMGYPAGGRSRFVDPRDEHRVYDRAGNSRGVVLQSGRVVATWTVQVRGDHDVTAAVTPLPGHRVARRPLRSALHALAPALGRGVSVEPARPSRA